MRGYRGVKYTLFICCYVFWVVSAVLIAVGIYAKIAKEKVLQSKCNQILHQANDGARVYAAGRLPPDEHEEEELFQVDLETKAEPVPQTCGERQRADLQGHNTHTIFKKHQHVVDTLTVDPALLLITVGSAMFLITFLGCSGALRNNTCLLKMFLGILVVVLLLQITAGVLGYLFTDMVMERTEKLMMKAIVQYREDPDLENAIDFIQKKFQCCGVESYKDWSRNVYFECSDTNPSLEACGVPFSCCIHRKNQTVLNTMCGYGMQQLESSSAGDDIYTIGCLEKIMHWAKKNLLLVGGLTAGLLLLEVCMIGLAAAQISWIKRVLRQKKESAARSKLERKDSYWYPAFTNFDDE